MATENMARTGQTDETDRLISSDKVEGTSVYNRNGENIGTINHLDRIAARLLSQRGIAAVWELHVKAAAAFRRGNWLSAAGLVTIADAAERLWRRRARR